jgi:hypothetical protein
MALTDGAQSFGAGDAAATMASAINALTRRVSVSVESSSVDSDDAGMRLVRHG